jgi:hypothetical protein
LDHISARKSFALETTLRSQVTFEQAQLAVSTVSGLQCIT